jgi:hypothetical protein
MDAVNSLAPNLEKIKPMLDELPAALDSWTRLQLGMSARVEQIAVDMRLNLALSRQILNALEPSLPLEIAEAQIAIAGADPRNLCIEGANEHGEQ